MEVSGGNLLWQLGTAASANSSISFGTTAMTLDTSKNLTVAGSFISNSDESIKTNWRDVHDGFLTGLSSVKCGIYDRTDIEATQLGVSAQSLMSVAPNAVLMDEHGKLSVAYGNVALVSSIKLAQKIIELEIKLVALESKLIKE